MIGKGKKVIPATPEDSPSSDCTGPRREVDELDVFNEEKMEEHLQDIVEIERRIKNVMEMIEKYDAKWTEHEISEDIDTAKVWMESVMCIFFIFNHQHLLITYPNTYIFY